MGWPGFVPKHLGWTWIAVLHKTFLFLTLLEAAPASVYSVLHSVPFSEGVAWFAPCWLILQSRVTSSSVCQLTSPDTELIFSSVICYHSSSEVQILTGCAYSLLTSEGKELGQNLQKMGPYCFPTGQSIVVAQQTTEVARYTTIHNPRSHPKVCKDIMHNGIHKGYLVFKFHYASR